MPFYLFRFAQTSLDTIAQAEGLTKGAIYHHFKNNEQIFEAVITAVLKDAIQTIEHSMGSSADHTSKAAQAIDSFINLCLSPDYQRIVLQDGPSVLGWEKWKTLEKQYTYPFVEHLVRELQNGRDYSSLTLEITTRLIIACLIEIAFMVMEAESKQETRAKAERFLLNIMNSVREEL